MENVVGRGRNRAGKPQEGQALMMVIFFVLFAALLLGVVIEVGHLFIVKRQLQNDADASATWGAMQLDIDGLRVSQGSSVEILSPGDSNSQPADRAGTNIIDFMAARGYTLKEWSWGWGRCALQINISRQVGTVFVSSLGIRQVLVNVTSKARLNNTDSKNSC